MVGVALPRVSYQRLICSFNGATRNSTACEIERDEGAVQGTGKAGHL
jgi:hypothetical protein